MSDAMTTSFDISNANEATNPPDRRRFSVGVMAALSLLGVGLAGCSTFNNLGQDVAIVRDLAAVAGCRLVGTITPPQVEPGLRRAAAYDDYLDELRRRVRIAGGTHLYLLNEAAGWGAAATVGTAYRCDAR